MKRCAKICRNQIQNNIQTKINPSISTNPRFLRPNDKKTVILRGKTVEGPGMGLNHD